MVKIKVCGITNIDDAKAAINAGADMLGFVFYRKSPRYIKPDLAKAIIAGVPKGIERVGLFVNEQIDDVKAIVDAVCGINILQFHGNETPEYCNNFGEKIIKAVRVRDKTSFTDLNLYKTDFLLLDSFSKDTYGGTGTIFNWELAIEAKAYNIPIILSGGLNPRNVKDAIAKVRPIAVDVSSGVEASPGKKDVTLLKTFIENAKNA